MKSVSVPLELLETMHSHPDCPVEFIDHLRRAISQPAGNAFKRCAILKECNVKSSPASGARINSIAKPITRRVCHGCVGLPRDVFCPVCDDEQPAPVAVVMPEPYGLAMFKMLSGFDSVTPEQFNLVWTACRKEAARLNGVTK